MSEKLWHENPDTITLWMPETDAMTLAIVGKMGEEAAELAARCHRCIIQGIDAIDPETGRTNRDELSREMADASATIQWGINYLMPPEAEEAYADRIASKYGGYYRWQNLILDELERQGKS